MAKATSNRREFLQLAEPLVLAKRDRKGNLAFKVGGKFLSEKLDGTRCFWDGGVSRDLPTDSVPWASILDPKTGKKKAKIKPLATGLWSRYGNPIMAPDWFLNGLPACPLDGELWAGRGNFQLCRSICGGDEPDPRFKQIKYAVVLVPADYGDLRLRRDQEHEHGDAASTAAYGSGSRIAAGGIRGRLPLPQSGGDFRRRVEVPLRGHRIAERPLLHAQASPAARRRDGRPRT